MSNEKKEMLLNKLVNAMELIGEVHSELMADTGTEKANEDWFEVYRKWYDARQKATTSSDEGGTNPGNPPPPPPPPPGGN